MFTVLMNTSGFWFVKFACELLSVVFLYKLSLIYCCLLL